MSEHPVRDRGVRLRWTIISCVVVCFLSLFFAGNGAYGWAALLLSKKNPFTVTPPTPEGERISRERGDAIVAALQAHHQATGTYPAALAELVPTYLAVIEQPTVGDRQWQYERLDNDRFRLRFWIGPSYQNDVITHEAQWRADR
jgi:hypothetical protein